MNKRNIKFEYFCRDRYEYEPIKWEIDEHGYYKITNYHGSIFVTKDEIDAYGKKFDGSYRLFFDNVKFGKVSLIMNGEDECEGVILKNLEGSPVDVGSFTCNNLGLESLKGCPKVVNTFICNGNPIVSLEGGPYNITETLYCSDTKIVNLEGGPRFIGHSIVLNNFNNNAVPTLKNLKGFPFYWGGNDYDIRFSGQRNLKLRKEDVGNDEYWNRIIKSQSYKEYISIHRSNVYTGFDENFVNG